MEKTIEKQPNELARVAKKETACFVCRKNIKEGEEVYYISNSLRYRHVGCARTPYVEKVEKENKPLHIGGWRARGRVIRKAGGLG